MLLGRLLVLTTQALGFCVKKVKKYDYRGVGNLQGVNFYLQIGTLQHFVGSVFAEAYEHASMRMYMYMYAYLWI